MTYFCCHSCDKVNAYDPGEAGALGSRLGLLLEAATVFFGFANMLFEINLIIHVCSLASSMMNAK